jgi:hypothetical protein
VEMLLNPSSATEAPANDAAGLAARHFQANLNALKASQGGLTPPALPNLTWLFARDGSLTALLDGERWWAGCSVPRAAARFMLKTMEVRGTVGCFLHPCHAAQLRVALDRLHARQAIVAIVPEAETFAVLLHAQDFSNDVAAGRLWFAAGAEWQQELEAIFDQDPGLPTPVEFIRPILADTIPADRLIDPAQTIFARVGSTRATRVQALLSEWRPQPRKTRRVCLLAGSEFRLWDDAALVLAELETETTGVEVLRLDPDRPTSASPLALADAAAQCDAILAANCFRQDLPGLTPTEQPWLTWITTSRIPPATDAGPNDRLLLADSTFLSIAARQGWEEHRIQPAGWPEISMGPTACSAAFSPSPGTPGEASGISDCPRAGWGGGSVDDPSGVNRRNPLPNPPPEYREREQETGHSTGLAIIADTHPLDPPKQLSEYSSQLVLWDLIREELAREPFLATGDMGQYLKTRRSRLQIGDAGFDGGMFVDRLIIPAIHQALATLLIRAGLPVRLFGRGWDQIEGLAEHHGGPVSSRAELGRILEASAAVVHLWPWETGHPVESAGRPVIRATGANALLREAHAALSRDFRLPFRATPPISMQALVKALP